jgi:hypothetical protein
VEALTILLPKILGNLSDENSHRGHLYPLQNVTKERAKMAAKNAKFKRSTEQVFFTDNLSDADRKRLSDMFAKSAGDTSVTIGRILDNGLSLKLAWSDYNDAYSATVGASDASHPSHGTFYSAFHSDWKKAVFVVDFLLKDRYDYGDWTKGTGKKFNNDW